jgi:PTS system nitrogen regulatory IIA component
VERLVARQGISVQVLDTSEAPRSKPVLVDSGRGGPGGLLAAHQILVLSKPMAREDLILDLCRLALRDTDLDPEKAASAVVDRERKGSTFLNSGLALPHASLAGMDGPRLALALPKAGLIPSLDGPLDAVFLLLTPLNAESRHLELLSQIGRAYQDAALRDTLKKAETPQAVLEALGAVSEFQPLKPLRSPA